MKIVIATAVYYPQINGVAVFSHNLAVGLVGRGHEVMVICPSQNGKNHFEMQDGVKVCYLHSIDTKVYPDQVHDVPEKKKWLGVKWPRLTYKHGFRVSIFPQKEIKRHLDKFKPDVVHIQVSDPIGLSVSWYARRRGIPVVTTEHNQPDVLTDPLHMPGFIKRPVNYLLVSYFHNRQSKSDFVTMPTERAIRNLLTKKELKVPIAAVSNGVDLTSFRAGKAPTFIYEKYGVSSGVPIVLYVGRLDPEKRVETIILAYERARQEVPKSQLVIVGDGVDKARLESKYGNETGVKFLGKITPPELYDVYKMGNVFATASEIETQGIVLIEAAASGLPLIAVDAGAVAEVCQNLVNGFLCKPGDAAGISKAMVKLLSDEKLRKEYAKKSIKIACEHDFERTLDQFINIYNKVIQNKRIIKKEGK